MRREPRGSYNGAAEILLNNQKMADVHVNLRGWVTMIPDDSGVPGPDIEGTKGWEGTITGLDEGTRFALLRERFTLRVGDGREGDALLRQGGILGSGPAPFDME